MILELIIGQLFLVLFNVGNAFFDAYRMMHNKKIAHGINFAAYLIVTVIICMLLHIPFKFYILFDKILLVYGPGLLFLATAFFNRQLSFDIPLNLRRGLAWDYQSTAQPPKSITDRIERFLFGTGPNVGKLIANFYMGCYVVLIMTFIVLYG